jgi:hypothetical protein
MLPLEGPHYIKEPDIPSEHRFGLVNGAERVQERLV